MGTGKEKPAGKIWKNRLRRSRKKLWKAKMSSRYQRTISNNYF